jgi:hypothetical protein
VRQDQLRGPAQHRRALQRIGGRPVLLRDDRAIDRSGDIGGLGGVKLVITSPFAGLRTSITLPVDDPNNGCAGSSSDMAKPSQSTDR